MDAEERSNLTVDVTMVESGGTGCEKGGVNFSVKYHRVNYVTPSEPTPMPLITETLRDLSSA